MGKLPNKLSELIRVALADLESVEGDPRYLVDMQRWHHPDFKKNTCQVCLAGSVMAKTLGATIDQFKTYGDYFQGHKLIALDFVRSGHLHDALHYMACINFQGLPKIVDVPEYDEDSQGFKEALLYIIKILEEKGL